MELGEELAGERGKSGYEVTFEFSEFSGSWAPVSFGDFLLWLAIAAYFACGWIYVRAYPGAKFIEVAISPILIIADIWDGRR